MKIPSPTEVSLGMTPEGGWTKATLAKWGVPWPPPKGWREELRRKYHQQEETKDVQS